MPCKHEGGKGACDRYPDGHCKYRQKSLTRRYQAGSRRLTGAEAKEYSDRGAAGEHLVISELLKRQLPTGGPYNQNGKHDLFVKTGGLWKTVQVKLGIVNTKTGYIQSRWARKGITSDLIAAVDLEGKRIRWISNTAEPVPEELL